MGTPLKPLRLFLSPTSRVSLSPSIHKSPVRNFYTPRARKRLDYSLTTTKPLKQSDVSIKIVGCSPPELKKKRSLLINSPNKLGLLQDGLKSENDFNVLGRGSFGTVVRGSYKGEDVAVKVIKTIKISTNEANALKLSHANIVRTIDVITKNESHSIIIMEYLPDSQHLQSIINNDNFLCQLSNRIIKYSQDIAKGLMYCHSKNLLHLDLKPSNVLVTNDSCKICDFGNSFMIGIDKYPHYQGTVQYTSPEILIGKTPTFSSDIYSLGIVMWQLRSRENPYMSLECRDSIIYNVVKYGLRPCMQKASDNDVFAILYQSCWRMDANARPMLPTILMKLARMQQSI